MRNVVIALVVVGACRPSGESAPPSDVRQPEQATTPAPTARTDAQQMPQPTVIVGCVPERPGVSFAEIRWVSGAAGQRRMAPDSTVLDMTVFKDGFQTGRFAALDATPQARVRAFFPPGPAMRAFSLANTSRRVAGDTTVVRVERLEPGINYIWRVRTNASGQDFAGSTVRVQVAPCVIDEPQ